jgi:hypothetical protein
VLLLSRFPFYEYNCLLSSHWWDNRDQQIADINVFTREYAMSDDQSTVEIDPETSTHRESIVISLFIVLFGISVLVGITYANIATATQTAYEDLQRNCGELASDTRLVDGGIGLMRQPLNHTAVAACQNITYAEYHQRRVQSMRTTPFNLGQWTLYGSVGSGSVIGGVALAMRVRRVNQRHN